MSLRLGIFFMRAATVAGLGNSIFPVPPKNFTRSLGMSTIASSWGSISSFSLFRIRLAIPQAQHKYPKDDRMRLLRRLRPKQGDAWIPWFVNQEPGVPVDFRGCRWTKIQGSHRRTLMLGMRRQAWRNRTRTLRGRLAVFPRCSLGPYAFRYGRFARALKNSQLTCGDVTIICETVHSHSENKATRQPERKRILLETNVLLSS